MFFFHFRHVEKLQINASRGEKQILHMQKYKLVHCFRPIREIPVNTQTTFQSCHMPFGAFFMTTSLKIAMCMYSATTCTYQIKMYVLFEGVIICKSNSTYKTNIPK